MTGGVRRAGERDDAAVSELLIASFADLYARVGLEMSPARRAYLADQAGRRSFAETFIDEVDGSAVGTVTLVPPSAHCEAWIDGAWDLRLLAVAPSMQGRGVARALVAHAERRAAERGATAVCLHARRGMAHQARFYPSCGYLRDPAGDLDGDPAQDGYSKIFGPKS